MAITEPEASVPEKPATERSKAQLWMIIIAALLAVALVIPPLFKSSPESDNQKPPELTQTPATPDGSEQGFLRRMEQYRRRLEADQQRTETPRVTELEQRRKELARQQQALQGPVRKQKSPLEQWQEDEALRVLNSRKSSIGFAYLNDENRGNAQPVQPTQTIAPQTASRPSFDSEHVRVQQELQRVQTLQQQMQQGGQLPSLLPPSANPEPNVQTTESALQGQVSEGPKPGQKLIPTGHVISAVLNDKLVSDYDGPFRALVTHDVYDIDKQAILIPKGAKVIGRTARITNVNEPIQARMGLTVNWMVLPDGKRISFDKSAGLDHDGIAAIKDQVNRHLVAQFLGVAAFAVLSGSTERNTFEDRSFTGDVGAGFRDQFAPLAEKYLNLVPTITLRPGHPIKIFLEDDVYAFPWKSLDQPFVSAR